MTAHGWKTFLVVLGPGLVVMLADTDVGSVVTAAQSGAQWGYKLLLLQFILMPILYVVQELTIRLGIYTGRGHGELIRETFGAPWAWVSVAGLGLATVGALLTEFSGVTGVGELLGIPRALSLGLAVGFLLTVVWTGSYLRVERIAIIFGLFELFFFWVAIAARPDPGMIWSEFLHAPIGNPHYLYLVAANIGAVIMPWMIFYQQSAVADKGLKPEHYTHARWDTAIGAVVTQLVMAAVLVASAATIGSHSPNASLDTVGQISEALTPYLGDRLGRIVFGLGILGAAMVASIVVSLAAAWGFGEVMGYKHSLAHHPSEAPWFYLVFTVGILGGAILVYSVPDLVALNLGVEVMNALLLPLVLGFLVALAIKALPAGHRLRGGYMWLVIIVAGFTATFGVFGGLSSLPGL